MSSAQLMVLYSILYCVILGSSLLFYRFIYPRKKISYLTLLVLIAFLPLISMLRPGSYESGDLSTHIMESIYFFKILGQGEYFPLWGGEMNATYGYPAFHFTYPLPFYVISFFHLIGFSFTASAKLLLAVSYLLSGVFMYLWLKRELRERAAFVGALFYLFAPYHLVDLHFRADIGEIVAFMFLPLVLFGAKRIMQTGSAKWFIVEVLSLAGLILSHPAVSMAGFPMLVLYIVILIKNQPKKRKKYLLVQGLSFISAVLLSAFYWLSVLGELRYTLNHQLSKEIIFISLADLLYSPYKYGLLFQGPKGQLSFLLGYPHLIILLWSVILLFRKIIMKKPERRLLYTSLGITVMSIFLMVDASKFLWDSIPFLKSFQFSYRLLGVTIFSLAVLSAIIANTMKKSSLIILLCLVVILSTILNWGNRRNVPEITDQVLREKIPFTATNEAGLGQAVPMWADPKNTWASVIPEKHIEILEGKGSIKELERKNVYHAYTVDAQTNLKLRENTLYFPGWNVYVDQKPQKIDILLSSKPRGVISFTIPPGKHTIEVIYEDTFIVRLAKMISVFTAIGLFFGVYAFSRMNKRKKHGYK